MFSESRKRPFVKILAAFILGILAVGFLGLSLKSVILLTVIFAIIAVFSKDKLIKSAYTTAIIALVASFLTIIHSPKDDIPSGQRLYLHVNIDNLASASGRWAAARATITHYAAADSTDMLWHKTSQRTNLYIDTSVHVNLGEKILMRGYVNPIESTSASYVRLMAARGLSTRIYLTDQANLLSRSTEPAPFFSRLSARVNAAARAKIDLLGLDEQALGLSKAMALGSRGDMPSELRGAYAATGTAHLLAVSGLHTGFVFMVLWALFFWMPLIGRGHIYRTFFVLAGLWCFATMALLGASVVRAAIMLSVAQVALALSHKVDRYNILASAAVIMLAINPMWLYDISFQLSFMAVASILFFLPRLLRIVRFKKRVLRYLWGLFMVGLAAQIGVVPLLCYSFGSLSVAGLIITPVLLLPAFTIIAVSLFWVVLPLGFLSAPCAWVINNAAAFQNFLVTKASCWTWASYDISLSAQGVVAYYGAMVIVISAIKYYEYKRQLKGLL